VYVGLETVEELDVSGDANGNDVNTIQLREFLWGDSEIRGQHTYFLRRSPPK
jgi:hypothetical protein